MEISRDTERLQIRTINIDIASQVLDYFKRNKDFLEQFEPKRDELFYTEEFQREEIRQDILLQAKGESLKLWIFKKDKTDRIIGNISFNNIIRGPFQACFIGYRLDKDEIRKGYMTEALKVAIEIAFKELKLHRLEANIMPNNKASMSVVEKLDFKNEGLAKKYLNINGKWEDHIHMVLINENY